MQLDAGFAERLRAGDADAVGSTALAPTDLELLLAADPAGVGADAGGKRRAQFLRNVASEHALTLARARQLDLADVLTEGFTASRAFHACVAADGRLPLAFGAWALERAEEHGEPLASALARLELTLARARRGPWPRPEPRSGEIVLSERAEAIEVPAGTLDAAGRIRSALDAGAAPPLAPAMSSEEREHVLVLAEGWASPHRLADVRVELLSPLAGALLVAARRPLDAAAQAGFRRAHDVTESELCEFVTSLAAEGILIIGARPT
jgi:hypothetical protein